MNRRTYIQITVIFFLFIGVTSSGQVYTASEEIRFISYLIDNNEYKDALFLLNRIDKSVFTAAQKDTLNYLKGWSNYCLKNLDSASICFESISRESGLFIKSEFYRSYISIYLENYNEALTLLGNLQTAEDSDMHQLKTFLISGIALLQRDQLRFKELSLSYDNNFYSLSKEQENFLSYSKKIFSIKLKSAFWAGLFSAFLPGSGKFYAGYRGQAFSAFFPSALLAGVAVENLLKAGMMSPQFILSGILFSVFYIGNIWGSALSVNTKYTEDLSAVNGAILSDMHLVLRRFFN